MVLNLICVSLFLVVLEWTAFVHGLRCYSCNSKSQRACEENFQLTSSNMTYIVDNCDVCNKYHFEESDVFVRNCTPKSSTGINIKFGCDKKKQGEETVYACACVKDLCNGARSEFAAFLVIVFVCLSVYSLYHLVAFDLQFI